MWPIIKFQLHFTKVFDWQAYSMFKMGIGTFGIIKWNYRLKNSDGPLDQ
jgi:hypothetical protein